MIEPTLALRTAIRKALVTSTAVTALVPAANIRSGSTRPDKTPCIILADGATMFLGHAAGKQYLARATLDIHIWATEDGQDTAKAIGFAVMNRLVLAPEAEGFSIDEFETLSVRWLRDPDPEKAYTHGVIGIDATLRWKS